jgi:hypothetical protein
VRLPGADDLFRPTADAPAESPAKPPASAGERSESGAGASGRVKHDEKITVYVTSAELMAVEQARLTLRAEHGASVDRGRLVRTAIALALADLEENGATSRLVRRLTEP